MTIATTARPSRADLVRLTSRMVRRLVEDLGDSLSALAERVDLDRSIGPRWCREDCAHPVPLYLLVSRHAVPDVLFDAIVEALRSARRAQPGRHALDVPAETNAVAWIARAGDALAVLATALADGRIAPEERRGARHAIGAVRASCDRLLESLARTDEPRPNGGMHKELA